MNVALHNNIYHFQKNFYPKEGYEVFVTCCGLHLKDYEITVVENDPMVTVPHCLDCIQNL
jgi:hypothetical protein